MSTSDLRSCVHTTSKLREVELFSNLFYRNFESACACKKQRDTDTSNNLSRVKLLLIGEVALYVASSSCNSLIIMNSNYE